jgi:hypothetical protein
MKPILSVLFIFSLAFAKAQQVQDYKYIIVPESFSSFEDDKFHLGPVFKQQVKKKFYETISDNQNLWPEEVKNVPCRALTVDMVKKSNWRKNILNVHFKTCDGQILEVYTGESSIKEYKEGYQDALQTALKTLKPSNPQPIAAKYVEMPEPTEQVFVVDPVQTSAPSIEIGTEFKNGNTIVLMTELKDGSIALIEKSSNKIIALLKPTSRNGVYQVTVMDAPEKYTTVGYFDGNTIGIDYLNSSKEFELKEFKKVQ